VGMPSQLTSPAPTSSAPCAVRLIELNLHMILLGGKSNTDQQEKGRTLRMRSDIVPGNVVPDYALPDHSNTVRKLSELQGRDPMVLLLSRGHF